MRLKYIGSRCTFIWIKVYLNLKCTLLRLRGFSNGKQQYRQRGRKAVYAQLQGPYQKRRWQSVVGSMGRTQTDLFVFSDMQPII